MSNPYESVRKLIIGRVIQIAHLKDEETDKELESLHSSLAVLEAATEEVREDRPASRVLIAASLVAQMLDDAERTGMAEDNPEGVRLITISDTLAKIMAKSLRGEKI